MTDERSVAGLHSGSGWAGAPQRVSPVPDLHVVDAAGLDGEGFQIEEGEVDFRVLAEQVDRLTPRAGFIPEIWQGHQNLGEGFWIALDRLERYF